MCEGAYFSGNIGAIIATIVVVPETIVDKIVGLGFKAALKLTGTTMRFAGKVLSYYTSSNIKILELGENYLKVKWKGKDVEIRNADDIDLVSNSLNDNPIDFDDNGILTSDPVLSSRLDELARGVGSLVTTRTVWLNNLKSQFNSNDVFSPQGLNPNTINSILKNQILDGFSTALPSNLKENFFNILIQSGRTVPVKHTLSVGDELYKIVPKGSGYTKSSFYMSKSEFNALKNSADIEQKLGLPLGSHAVEYDVYKAAANQSVDVFESTVANTVQGGYITIGGAKQTFLLDDSKWTITLESNSLIPLK